MGLSQEGKGFILFVSIILIAALILIVTIMLFRPMEYSAKCSIDGVNIGIDNEMNFTGFNLDGSEVKCDITGEVPLIAILGSLGK